MKKRIYLIAVLLVVTVIVGTGFISKDSYDFSMFSTEGLELNYNVPTEAELIPIVAPVTPKFYLFLGKSYVGFKEALGFKESRGNYNIVNDYGYMGKYQFSHATLRMIGFKNTDNFLYDTRQQEAAFLAYTSLNKWVLRNDIKRYAGKTIGGVKITESGILAAAHLAGAGNVKKFLRSAGENRFEDANGASIRYYLRKFSGYDTSHIVPNKKPRVI
ncbi:MULTISPECIES: peptidoglycan-binding protein LysM [Aequorivita]|uniref:Peptidoglycan-binding protein LysM n=1 Tax=Aequorivita iocasae TaxID=2803865 RepID=A0ABX7DT64_9FLAO|nr:MULTISPECIES: peptidoglycan-binding protein LysM [Aequorivita]QQX76697.1 peptidoglycan-binding protein LysM [Aequorivita iocasae]UCA56169.1 peptidoglycan-binding protein LysM [Aequorivita sp. F7]